jgi:hypothetical protein
MKCRQRKLARQARRKAHRRTLRRLGMTTKTLYWASHFGGGGRYDLCLPGLGRYALEFSRWVDASTNYWSPYQSRMPDIQCL